MDEESEKNRKNLSECKISETWPGFISVERKGSDEY